MGVITIAGGKGGVGKSTTTATLGCLLDDAGVSVALVDADLAMANLAELLDVSVSAGIHEVLAGELPVEEVLIERDEGPDLVPGGVALQLFAKSDPAELRAVVDPIEDDYDVVLIDTGAGLGHETLVAAGLADHTLLVTSPNNAALVDVAKTAKFIEHADANIAGAIVTATAEHTAFAEIANRLDVPIIGAIPADDGISAGPALSGPAGEAYESLVATLLAAGLAVPPVTPAADAAVQVRPEEPAEMDGSAAAEAEQTERGGVGALFSFGD
jgi:septum site-determining protein MinD